MTWVLLEFNRIGYFLDVLGFYDSEKIAQREADKRPRVFLHAVLPVTIEERRSSEGAK